MDLEIILTEESPGQWSYRVGTGIYQSYDPDEPGNVPMSRERAEACAAIVLARLMPPEAPDSL